jgi:hypothetical protein
MHYLDTRRIEMLNRVYDFGLSHLDDFPSDSPGAQKFSIVGASILELYELAVLQPDGANDTQRCSKASARWTLLETLEAFDRTADAIAIDVEGLEDKFRTPGILSDLNLLCTAHTFVEDAISLRKEFLELTMPETFIEDLRADIKRLEEAIIDQTILRGAALTRMTAIDHAIEKAMEALLQLDAIVSNKYYYDDRPEHATTWKCLVRYVDRTDFSKTSQGLHG